MHRLVLDTNIIVSAIIGTGSPRKVLELIFRRKATLCLSSSVYAEYVQVLKRPKFFHYPDFYEASIQVLNNVKTLAFDTEPQTHLAICSDSADNKFLELALEAGADYLITGNKKHFPHHSYKNIEIISSSEYLSLLKV